MRTIFAFLLMAQLAAAQGRGAAATATSASAERAAAIRANYSKFEYRIAMRDGVKLFTSVYVPKDVFSDGKTYPILMERTGYNVAPYGSDLYRANLGPSELFEREKFIFIYQDVRGRFMSEGDFVTIRPHKPVKKGPQRESVVDRLRMQARLGDGRVADQRVIVIPPGQVDRELMDAGEILLRPDDRRPQFPVERRRFPGRAKGRKRLAVEPSCDGHAGGDRLTDRVGARPRDEARGR